MTTTKERDIFATEVLSSIWIRSDELPNKEVTGFLSMKGNLFDDQLMYVGQAVNG